MNGRKRKWSILHKRGGRRFDVGGLTMWWYRSPYSWGETYTLVYEPAAGGPRIVQAGEVYRRKRLSWVKPSEDESAFVDLPGWYAGGKWFQRRCEAKRWSEQRAAYGVRMGWYK